MLEKRKNGISTLLVRFDVEITIFLHSNWTDPNDQNKQLVQTSNFIRQT